MVPEVALFKILSRKTVMLLIGTASFGALLSFTSAAFGQTVSTCTVDQKYACSNAGCKKVESTIVVRIDWDRQQYSRCDTKGCDDYQVVFAQSGSFINITPIPINGSLAKVNADDGSFLEVATIVLSTLVSYGSCNTVTGKK